MKNNKPVDNIPEKIHARLHIIYFILKCIFAGAVFIVLWNPAVFMYEKLQGNEMPEKISEESPFLFHQYCGTFFVEFDKDNSFESPEAYTKYIEAYADKEEPLGGAESVVMGVMTITLVAGLILALRSGDKKRIFCGKASRYFLLVGTIWAAGNIYTSISSGIRGAKT
ncbi:hypothetical protein [Ruminococcus sp.]|uniref:hypothetical protein n=1 Tax=Ruminococcus sp. TaxID=41978 RepID=UPI0025E182C9|nr:hypothetical protein [Ruminococcus sp.]MBQ8965871.1 hypothetical protein [Ruminococcus sp.]